MLFDPWDSNERLFLELFAAVRAAAGDSVSGEQTSVTKMMGAFPAEMRIDRIRQANGASKTISGFGDVEVDEG